MKSYLNIPVVSCCIQEGGNYHDKMGCSTGKLHKPGHKISCFHTDNCLSDSIQGKHQHQLNTSSYIGDKNVVRDSAGKVEIDARIDGDILGDETILNG